MEKNLFLLYVIYDETNGNLDCVYSPNKATEIEFFFQIIFYSTYLFITEKRVEILIDKRQQTKNLIETNNASCIMLYLIRIQINQIQKNEFRFDYSNTHIQDNALGLYRALSGSGN